MIWSGSSSFFLRQIPNSLSILRGMLALVVAFLLLSKNSSHHLVALGLFLFASFTDYLDGVLARKYSVVSDFGKIVDPTTDKILILLPLVILSKLGLLPYVLVFVIILREIAVTFCRFSCMAQGIAIGAEKIGKLKFAFQVLTVFIAFLTLLSTEYAAISGFHSLFESLLRIAFFGAIIFTYYSGFTFFFANRKNFDHPRFAQTVCALGVGLAPGAPGTWGSALALGWIVLCFQNAFLYLFLFLLFLWLGSWAISKIDLKATPDPSFMILDEVSGMLVSLWGVPLSWETAISGFVLFRLFDIIKPFPLRRLEKIPGYWGIMLDDLGAGIYTRFCLFFLFQS